MLRLCAVIALICASCDGYCQQNPADKRLLDSLIKTDDFLSMLDSLGKPRSYAKITLGVGNKLFSVNNNSLNSMEESRKIMFIPSVEYFHKSGLGISFAGFLLNQNHKTGFFQYTLTPSYDYTSGKFLEAGVSYTRFFVKDKYGSASSPIQNDAFGYVNVKKAWLRPGLSFGYAAGDYNEINFIDTTVYVQNRPVRIKFTDSAVTKINALSVIASVSHVFPAYDILGQDDAFYFIPQLSLNMGSNKYTVSHKSTTTTTTTYRSYRKRKKTRIRNFQEEESVAPHFNVQSAGLNLDFNYTTGSFNFQPQVYFDYYLLSTTDKKFTQIFSVNVGYIF